MVQWNVTEIVNQLFGSRYEVVHKLSQSARGGGFMTKEKKEIRENLNDLTLGSIPDRCSQHTFGIKPT